MPARAQGCKASHHQPCAPKICSADAAACCSTPGWPGCDRAVSAGIAPAATAAIRWSWELLAMFLIAHTACICSRGSSECNKGTSNGSAPAATTASLFCSEPDAMFANVPAACSCTLPGLKALSKCTRCRRASNATTASLLPCEPAAQVLNAAAAAICTASCSDLGSVTSSGSVPDATTAC